MRWLALLVCVGCNPSIDGGGPVDGGAPGDGSHGGGGDLAGGCAAVTCGAHAHCDAG